MNISSMKINYIEENSVQKVGKLVRLRSIAWDFLLTFNLLFTEALVVIICFKVSVFFFALVALKCIDGIKSVRKFWLSWRLTNDLFLQRDEEKLLPMLVFMLIEVVFLLLDSMSNSDRIFDNVFVIIMLGYCILVVHSLCRRFRDECAQGENLRMNTRQHLPQYVQETVDPPIYEEVAAQFEQQTADPPTYAEASANAKKYSQRPIQTKTPFRWSIWITSGR